MRRSQVVSLVLAAVIGFGSLGGVLIAGWAPVLGVQLQGGVEVLLRPTTPADDEQLDQAIEIIRSRVDALGVAEPDITRQGEQVVIQLPGVKDKQRAVDLVGQTAELRFRPVIITFSPYDEQAFRSAISLAAAENGEADPAAEAVGEPMEFEVNTGDLGQDPSSELPLTVEPSDGGVQEFQIEVPPADDGVGDGGVQEFQIEVPPADDGAGDGGVQEFQIEVPPADDGVGDGGVQEFQIEVPPADTVPQLAPAPTAPDDELENSAPHSRGLAEDVVLGESASLGSMAFATLLGTAAAQPAATTAELAQTPAVRLVQLGDPEPAAPEAAQPEADPPDGPAPSDESVDEPLPGDGEPFELEFEPVPSENGEPFELEFEPVPSGDGEPFELEFEPVPSGDDEPFELEFEPVPSEDGEPLEIEVDPSGGEPLEIEADPSGGEPLEIEVDPSGGEPLELDVGGEQPVGPPLTFTPPEDDLADRTVVLPDRRHAIGYVLGPAELTGEAVAEAAATFNNEWVVNVDLNEEGAIGFDAIAARYFGEQVAIVLDGVIESAPVIRANEFGGTAVISGAFGEEEARDLAVALRFGALPVVFEQDDVRTVSATLGEGTLRAGAIAGLVGLIAVGIYNAGLLSTARAGSHRQLGDKRIPAVVAHQLAG